MNIGIVVLAAGASTRLGEPKQLITLNGVTLLRRAALTALETVHRPVAMVLGASNHLFRGELDGLDVAIAENKHWSDGMGSSIRCGMEHLLSIQPSLDAALLMVCDQPFVSAELLNALVEKHRRTTETIIACDYGESVGVPALFPKRVFFDLLQLRGSEGAKKLIVSQPYSTISFPDGAFDIDTPTDVTKLRQAFSNSARS